MTRELTEQEFKAHMAAYSKCDIEGGTAAKDRLLFRAGFVAGLDYQQTDSSGRTWHIMEREDKSVSIYYTIANSPAHYVVFDSLDAGLDESEAADDTP